MANWYDSVEAAAEELARTAVASRLVGGMVKRANPFSDAAAWFGRQPLEMQGAMGGAALGGLGGAMLGYRDRERRDPLTTTLTGALGGAALGGGGAAVAKHWGQWGNGANVDPKALEKGRDAAADRQALASHTQGQEFGRALREGGPPISRNLWEQGKGVWEGLTDPGTQPGVVARTVLPTTSTAPVAALAGGGLVPTLRMPGEHANLQAKRFHEGVQALLPSAEKAPKGAAPTLTSQAAANKLMAERLDSLRQVVGNEIAGKVPGRSGFESASRRFMFGQGGMPRALQTHADRLDKAIDILRSESNTAAPGLNGPTNRQQMILDDALTSPVARQYGRIEPFVNPHGLSRAQVRTLLERERTALGDAVMRGEAKFPQMTIPQSLKRIASHGLKGMAGGYILGRAGEMAGDAIGNWWEGSSLPQTGASAAQQFNQHVAEPVQRFNDRVQQGWDRALTGYDNLIHKYNPNW